MSDIDTLKRDAVKTTLEAMNRAATPTQIAAFASMLGDGRDPDRGFAREPELATYINTIKAERQCKGQPLSGMDIETIAGPPNGDKLGIPWMARMISKQIDHTPRQPRTADRKSYCAMKAADSGGAAAVEPPAARIVKFTP